MAQKGKYDDAFKQNAVGLVMSGHKASQVARDLGLNPETLYQWVRKHRESTEPPERLRSNAASEPSVDAREAHRELARLRKELELVKMERDILKKAVGIFSQQLP